MWILFLLASSASQTYLCSGCSRPYSIGTYTTVGACPTGYNLESSACIPSSNLKLFSIDFSLFTSMASSSAGDFSVDSGDFSTIGNPFPTISRGFYFPVNGVMSNRLWVPSPDLVFDIWIRIITEGTFFSIGQDSAPFLILRGQNTISLDYTYCNSSNICEFTSNIYAKTTLQTTPIRWKNFRLEIQVIQKTTMSAIIKENYVQNIEITLDGQNAISITSATATYTHTLGSSSSGFSGFIYAAMLYNEITTTKLKLYSPPLCDPNSFYNDDGSCVSCPANCNNNGWCIRSSDCSICVTNQCNSCTGYTIAECSSFNLQCPDNCVTCTGKTECTQCSYGSIKRLKKSGLYCEKDLRFNLVSSRVDDFLISGTTENYYPHDAYDSNDPIPKPGRGHYFESTKYLKTRSNVLVPLEYMIYIWIFPFSSGKVFSLGSTYLTTSALSLIKQNIFTASINRVNFGYAATLNNWNYYTFKVYLSEKLRVDIRGNTSTSAISDFSNRYDNGTLKITVGDAIQGFKGFIAYVGVTSVSLDPSLFADEYMKNFNTANGVALNPCNSLGNIDCSVTCTYCESCYDWTGNFCYRCPFGYYHASTTCPGTSSSSTSIIIGDYSYTSRGNCILIAKGLG